MKKNCMFFLVLALTNIIFSQETNKEIISKGFHFSYFKYQESTQQFKDVFNTNSISIDGYDIKIINYSYYKERIGNHDYGRFIDAVWIRKDNKLLAIAYENIIVNKEQVGRGIEFEMKKIEYIKNGIIKLYGKLDGKEKQYLININTCKVN
jgi:hypothetical protein